MAKKILVYADWEPLAQASQIGELNADLLRGREIFSFEYNPAWLAGSAFSFFDPDLSLFPGRQFVPQDKKLFGVFTDSCPDRWGRLLMKRREAILAREEGRPERKLTESDFLLGIQDIARTGALRFKTEQDGAFLADSSKYTVPVWTPCGTEDDTGCRKQLESSRGTVRPFPQPDWGNGRLFRPSLTGWDRLVISAHSVWGACA